MSEEVFYARSAADVLGVVQFLRRITFPNRKGFWRIRAEWVERRARIDQEAVLRGKERKIAQFTGQDPDEVHDEMLARHYGTVEIDLGNGKVLVRPARRTRTGPNPLSETEMPDHIRYVEAFAASFLGLQV